MSSTGTGRSRRLGNDCRVLRRVRDVVPTAKLVRVPDGVDTRTAAALMLQGMTAHYLTRSTFPLKSGDTALVHAAAGGAGLLITQLAKNVGARVIGTVSTQAKAKLAHDAGADEVILYTEQDFEAETKRLTNDKGVDVVYDSVGVTTFEKSLNSLRPRGNPGLFRPIQRTCPAVRPRHTQPERIALSHSPDSRALRAHPRGTDLAFRRAVHRRARRQAERSHRNDLSACRGGASASRSRSRKTTGKLLLVP